MVVSALGVEVALAVNAVNFLFAAIVFPLGMAFLMKVLFSGDRAIALIGALGAVAVGAFPWVLVEVWPLYPNTAAFALVPVLVACFAAVWGRDASRRERVAYGAVFVLGCCCMAFMQPNAVFSAAVFLILFACIDRRSRRAVDAGSRNVAWRSCWRPGRSRSRALPCCGWLRFLCLHARSRRSDTGLRSIQGAGSRERARMGFAGSSVHRSLRASSRRRAVHAAQTTLSLADVLVSSGMLHLLRFGRGGRYPAQTRTVGVLVYRSLSHRRTGRDTGSSASGDGTVRRVQDRREDSCIRSRARREPFEGAFSGRRCRRLPRIELLAGSRGARTGPGRVPGIAATATALNDGSAVNAYSEEKSRFSKHVKEVVPSGALIVNQPYDGSLFAYSLDDLNLYYRDISGYGGEDERPESSTIRCRLAAEASNPSVRDAVLTTGAEYLLVLDRDVSA